MEKGERRLATIMFTDLVGYASLSQRNESLALRLLENHRQLLRSIFPKYGGREIKTVGDSFLVEFSSSLEAAKCSVAIQKSIQEENSRRAGDERVLTRIGLHLGDVVHSGHDVYGEDINIASRIAPIAQPGGVCVTEQVFAMVRNKLEYPLMSVGHIGLKNVDLPLEVYVMSLPWTPYP